MFKFRPRKSGHFQLQVPETQLNIRNLLAHERDKVQRFQARLDRSTPLPGWRAFLAKETVSKNPWGWNTVGFPGNQESCMLEQREQREGQNFYCLFRIYYESERILWHYSKYDTKLYVCPSLSLCSSLYLCLSTKACVGVCLCVRHIYIQREGEAQHKVMSATRKNNEELNLGLIYTCVVNFDRSF